MTSWQPIETAPKDGTRVLVATKAAVYIAKYGEYRKEDSYFYGWYEYDCDDPWYSTDFQYHPLTHWRPLPELPEASND